jgi:hypothetical protein
MAAGLGYKEFSTGDVLTAADANGYLASQVVMVFASAAARTSAIASPQEGMISYLKDTNSTEYYSGSAWVAIGGGGSAGALVYVGGAPFTSAASQSLNNVFTSTYENYFIALNVTSKSATTPIQIRLRASGSDNTTSNYQSIATYTQINAGSTGDSKLAAGTAYQLSDVGDLMQTFNIMNPQTAQSTVLLGMQSVFKIATDFYSTRFSGYFNATTSFDGLTIYPTSGTFTGTIRVYGIANS